MEVQGRYSEVKLDNAELKPNGSDRDFVESIKRDRNLRYFARIGNLDRQVAGGGPTGDMAGLHAKDRTQRQKRRCRYCPLEVAVCEHDKPGRKRLGKSAWLRPHLPSDYEPFLRRSKLQLQDVVLAVLDSPIMKCWPAHREQPTSCSPCDDDGNKIYRTAYDEKIYERRYSMRVGPNPPDHLKYCEPTQGPRLEERMKPEVRDRIRSVGRAARGRYSDSRFAAFCVAYYVRLVWRVRNEPPSRYGARVHDCTSSRSELARVHDLAIRDSCNQAHGPIDVRAVIR